MIIFEPVTRCTFCLQEPHQHILVCERPADAVLCLAMKRARKEAIGEPELRDQGYAEARAG